MYWGQLEMFSSARPCTCAPVFLFLLKLTQPIGMSHASRHQVQFLTKENYKTTGGGIIAFCQATTA